MAQPLHSEPTMLSSRLIPSTTLIALLGVAALAAACGDDGGSDGGPAAGPTGPTSGTVSSGSAGGTGGDGGATSTSSTVGGGGEGGTATATSGAGGMADGGGGAGGMPPAQDPQALFNATVKPGLLSECNACHKLGGPADSPFLAGPDIYVSITTYPGIIVPTASQSILLTHPSEATHGGGLAPDLSPTLRAKVDAWLQLEASLIPPPQLPMFAVTPFKPKVGGALNSIYLDALGPEYENVSMTFTATELGAPISMLLIDNIEIHPVSQMQMLVTHPLFTAYPQDVMLPPVPDPADNFSDVDDVFSLASNTQLGTGTMIHTGWSKNAFLGIAFENIELVGDFVPPIPCKDLATYVSNVKPQLTTCAVNCHGGNNANAQGAMDLSLLATDDAATCQAVRARTKPGVPENSQVLIVTNPLDPSAHLFKFMGSTSQYNNFKNQVTPWILAEQ
jgi:hypothetical protein